MILQKFASIAVFAEDIRAEQKGLFTIVGIMPDNINYEAEGDSGGTPTMPHLAIYVRTILAIDNDMFSDLLIEFFSPSGQVLASSPIGADFLNEKRAESLTQGSPQVTVITQIKAASFPVLEHGQFKVTATYQNQTILSGYLNITGNHDLPKF